MTGGDGQCGGGGGGQAELINQGHPVQEGEEQGFQAVREMRGGGVSVGDPFTLPSPPTRTLLTGFTASN